MKKNLKVMIKDMENNNITKYKDSISIEFLNEDESYIGSFYELDVMGNGNYFPIIKANEVKKYTNTEENRDIIYRYRYLDFAIETILDDGDIEQMTIYVDDKREYTNSEELEIMQAVYEEFSFEFEEEEERQFCNKYGLKYLSYN